MVSFQTQRQDSLSGHSGTRYTSVKDQFLVLTSVGCRRPSIIWIWSWWNPGGLESWIPCLPLRNDELIRTCCGSQATLVLTAWQPEPVGGLPVLQRSEDVPGVDARLPRRTG